LPSPEQIFWQRAEVGAMITFNMQTWGFMPVGYNGSVPAASTFVIPTPDAIDSWVRAAASFGAKYAVLTATHRSGFALWPTKAHSYSVANAQCSGLGDGSGQCDKDILGLFVSACRKHGLIPSVFWTQRFCFFYGVYNFGTTADHWKQPLFDVAMLTELEELAEYGFEEIWLNGALEHDTSKDVPPLLALRLRELFPRAICHSCLGISQEILSPGQGMGVRWMGNEDARMPLPSWGAVNTSALASAKHHYGGNPFGDVYMPPSCDTVLRKHTWWAGIGGDHICGNYTSCRLKTSAEVVQDYLYSVGRSCNYVLNIAPGTDGMIMSEELAVYADAGRQIQQLFAHPMLQGSEVYFPPATTPGAARQAVLDLTSGPLNITLALLVLEEDLSAGQRIGAFKVEAVQSILLADTGMVLASGTSIGHKRILRIGHNCSSTEIPVHIGLGCGINTTFEAVALIITISPLPGLELAKFPLRTVQLFNISNMQV